MYNAQDYNVPFNNDVGVIYVVCFFNFYNLIILCWRTSNIRPNNLFLVCLYLSLYISFLVFGHIFSLDKYRHTRDRLYSLIFK